MDELLDALRLNDKEKINEFAKKVFADSTGFCLWANVTRFERSVNDCFVAYQPLRLGGVGSSDNHFTGVIAYKGETYRFEW